MGKQSRLRKAKKIVKEKGGVDPSSLSLLKSDEAYGMNANTGKLSIQKRR
jgi:hypothetical protein